MEPVEGLPPKEGGALLQVSGARDLEGREGLPRLRTREVDGVIRGAFGKGSERFGFRLVEYPVQEDHLHMIAEARDRRALSRGMQGLLIRVAKALNRLWNRRGSVFADRYHDRILRTPREVRNALAYVLHHARRHGRCLGQVLDRCSSAPWFQGFRAKLGVKGLQGVPWPGPGAGSFPGAPAAGSGAPRSPAGPPPPPPV